MESSYINDLNVSEKEKKILEAAITVFSEKGFSAATTNEIARNAGIAEGTIFRYFKTKKDILRGIMIQTINIMGGKLVIQPLEKILLTSDKVDIRQIIKDVIYDRIKLLDTIFPMARIVLTEALYHDDIREAIFENIIIKSLEMFKTFHSHMTEKGLLRDDVEPEAIFRSVLGNIFILIAQKKLFGDKFRMDDFDAEIDRMVDVLLYGISNSQSPIGND